MARLHRVHYVWSSYAINAVGKQSVWCQPHFCYKVLEASEAEQQQTYRDLFKGEIYDVLFCDIRSTVKSCMALGIDNFEKEVANLTGRQQQMGWP